MTQLIFYVEYANIIMPPLFRLPECGVNNAVVKQASKVDCKGTKWKCTVITVLVFVSDSSQ